MPALPIVIVMPGEEPAVVKPGSYELPDGDSGLMTGMADGDIPATLMMPCNEFRPQCENLTNYFIALASARAALMFGQLKGQEHARPKALIPVLMKMLHLQAGKLIETVGMQLIRECDKTPTELQHLLDMGFLPIHNKFCPGGDECKDQIRKAIFGDARPV